MELTRVIHPVGQGGFCTETFTDDSGKEVFNVVYDCGSETEKPRGIISYLEDYYKQIKEIDAVFISHLHEDHINGLDWLLKNVKVRFLFLPQLTPNVVIEAYLFNYIKSGGSNSQGNVFIDSLFNGNYATKTVEVEALNDQEDNPTTYSLEEIESIDGPIRSGDHFPVKVDDTTWLYIPYNSPYKPNSGIENDKFFSSAIVNGKFDYKQLENLVKTKGVDACKNIYVQYFGKNNHNSYSMTLFSGVSEPILFGIRPKWRRVNRCYCCADKRFSPNFLYTGDFEPNSFVSLLESSLTKKGLWNTISGIQVPHHGSRNNYHCDLYKHPIIGYISAGSRNKYKHPNVDTLVNIHKLGCYPIIVSEDPSSMQEEVYRFKKRSIY